MFALLQTKGIFHLVQFVKCWRIFLELNSKGLYQSSEKEKEGHCIVFTSSTKSEIRQFHVVVVQKWPANRRRISGRRFSPFFLCYFSDGEKRRPEIRLRFAGYAETAKKCTKKRDARANLLFCQSKPIAFLPFSLRSPLSLPKLPDVVCLLRWNVLTFKSTNLIGCLTSTNGDI